MLLVRNAASGMQVRGSSVSLAASFAHLRGAPEGARAVTSRTWWRVWGWARSGTSNHRREYLSHRVARCMGSVLPLEVDCPDPGRLRPGLCSSLQMNFRKSQRRRPKKSSKANFCVSSLYANFAMTAFSEVGYVSHPKMSNFPHDFHAARLLT